MIDPDLDARYRLARSVATHAGREAIAHWRNRSALTVSDKGSLQDLVSEADRAVERLIRDAIAAEFPADGILGEEYGLNPGSSRFTWVIDPIDGTSPFLHGLPSWCVAIAVVCDGTPVIAAIEVPTEDAAFAACLGRGAELNGDTLTIRPGTTLASAAIGIGASHRSDPASTGDAIARLMAAGGVFFRNGSGALMLAYVAAGRLAGYVEAVMHPWDCLAGLLLVREAGGRTAPYGDPADITREGPVLAATPEAWDDLQRLFG